MNEGGKSLSRYVKLKVPDATKAGTVDEHK
jgi:hypothetical protein